jgi:hypothetical protein
MRSTQAQLAHYLLAIGVDLASVMPPVHLGPSRLGAKNLYELIANAPATGSRSRRPTTTGRRSRASARRR